MSVALIVFGSVDVLLEQLNGLVYILVSLKLSIALKPNADLF